MFKINRVIIILVLFVSTFMLSFGGYFFRFYSDEDRVHIFIDCATGPILLQSIHLLELPLNEKKIIAWFPFSKNPDFNYPKYNIEFLEYFPKNKEWQGYAAQREIEKRINNILKDNPKTKFVIYTNIFHSRTFLRHIDKIHDNIEMIHLYEDGIGNTVASRRDKLETFALDRANPPTDRWSLDYPYFYHLKYPVTYHLAFVDDIKNDFSKMAHLLEGATITEINLSKLKSSLSDKIKSELAHFYTIDTDFKYVSDKKRVVLLASRPMGTNEEYQKELNLYKSILKNKDFLYFFKPHPNKASLRFVRDLKKDFPSLKVIESSLPIELFYLLGMEPDFISGYSSSVFLSLPKEKFLFYIQRKEDSYLPFLLKKGIINQEQVIDRHLR